MAHFYGGISGNRGPATRMGTKRSGFDAYAASWEGSVHIWLHEVDGVDYARVELRPWMGQGTSRELFNGPVSGKRRARRG